MILEQNKTNPSTESLLDVLSKLGKSLNELTIEGRHDRKICYVQVLENGPSIIKKLKSSLLESAIDESSASWGIEIGIAQKVNFLSFIENWKSLLDLDTTVKTLQHSDFYFPEPKGLFKVLNQAIDVLDNLMVEGRLNAAGTKHDQLLDKELNNAAISLVLVETLLKPQYVEFIESFVANLPQEIKKAEERRLNSEKTEQQRKLDEARNRRNNAVKIAREELGL